MDSEPAVATALADHPRQAGVAHVSGGGPGESAVGRFAGRGRPLVIEALIDTAQYSA